MDLKPVLAQVGDKGFLGENDLEVATYTARR